MPRITCAPFVHVTVIYLLRQVVVESVLHLLGPFVGLVLANDLLHSEPAAVIVSHVQPRHPSVYPLLLKSPGLVQILRGANSRPLVGTGPGLTGIPDRESPAAGAVFAPFIT